MGWFSSLVSCIGCGVLCIAGSSLCLAYDAGTLVHLCPACILSEGGLFPGRIVSDNRPGPAQRGQFVPSSPVTLAALRLLRSLFLCLLLGFLGSFGHSLSYHHHKCTDLYTSFTKGFCAKQMFRNDMGNTRLCSQHPVNGFLFRRWLPTPFAKEHLVTA